MYHGQFNQVPLILILCQGMGYPAPLATLWLGACLASSLRRPHGPTRSLLEPLGAARSWGYGLRVNRSPLIFQTL